MTKVLHDDVLDAALDWIANAGDIIFLCTAAPTTYTQASSTYKLADHAMTEGDGNGDYTIGDDGTSGRKLTVVTQTGIVVDTTGTVTHVAICDSVAQKVLAVTSVTSQSVTAAGTCSLAGFTVTVNDPT